MDLKSRTRSAVKQDIPDATKKATSPEKKSNSVMSEASSSTQKLTGSSELDELLGMASRASTAFVPQGLVERNLNKSRDAVKEEPKSEAPAPAFSKTGLWWIHGREYDLTNWKDKHPGGRYLLDITKGTDCTELYESYHAASLKQDYIAKTLEKYATQPASEPLKETTYDWVNTPVYNDLKEVVREYHRNHGIKASDNWVVCVCWYAVWAALHYFTLYHWVLSQGSYLNAVLLGCTIWCFSTDMMHSGTHYQLTRNAKTSEWLGWLCGWMFILPSTWIRQHVTGHHVHTNTLEKDPDLYHYQDIMNVHPDETRIPPSPFLFFLAPITTQWVPSFFYTFPLLTKDKWEGTDGPYVGWSEGEWGSLLTQWGCVWAVLLYTGYHSIGMVFTPFVVDSVLYYAFSQVSHCNAASHIPHETSREFCVHQILTSSGDYGYASRFWTLMSIGLNNQGFHHCFPSVHSVHYSAIAKLALPVYEKHGLVSPGYTQNFWESLMSHWDHLCEVNAPHWDKKKEKSA